MVRIGLALTLLCTFVGCDMRRPASLHGSAALLAKNNVALNLGPALSVRVDTEGRLNPADICPAGGGFTPAREDAPAFGYTRNVIWVRFQLKLMEGASPAGGYTLEIDHPMLDSIRVYYYRGADLVGEEASGRILPLSNRNPAHQYFLFPAPPLSTDPLTVCIRAQSEGVMIVPVNIYSPERFILKERAQLFGFGLYYGLLFAIFAYNLFLFFTIRERTYLLYCCYVATLALFQLSLNGLLYFLWPESPRWNRMTPLFATAFLAITATLFVRSFIGTRERHPRLDKIWLALLFIAVVLACAAPFGEHIRMAPALALTGAAMTVFTIITGVASLRQGYRPARWFLIAWAMPLAGLLLLALRNFHLAPSVWITEHGVQLGTAVEALLLSMALGDRVNLLKRELAEFNEGLERTVTERTQRLNEALLSLSRHSVSIENELELARSIQQWILAPSAHVSARVKARVHCQFLHAVGGDFYEFIEFPDGHFGAVLADASGHGIPAGFLTALAKISISEGARRVGPNPRALLLEMNREMNRLIKTHEYFTAIALSIGPGGALRYSSGGHRPSFLLRREERDIVQLDTAGILIGIYDNHDENVRSMGELSMAVRPGDRLLLITDGAADVEDASGERLGELALARFALTHLELDIDLAFTSLVDRWREYHAAGKRDDDATLVLLEIR